MTTKRKRPSNPLSENIAVPNGTTNGVIEQCRTVVQAEEELAPKYFERFCDKLRISSATLRKLKKIGQEADRECSSK